jgi:exo-1,4-beta-D-glucosaminidase
MAPVPLDVTARRIGGSDDNRVSIRLHNASQQIAFFERAEVMSKPDGDEVLPIEYSDNYVTVFPGETVDLTGAIPTSGVDADWVRVTGYNTAAVTVPVQKRD